MRIRWLIVYGILLGGIFLGWREFTLLPDGRLHMYALDVGQGDAILLVSPSGKQILMDGGPDLSALEQLGRHMSYFDRTIELLILSHPNLDHLAAFPEILRRYRVERVLMTGADYPLQPYQKMLQLIAEQHIPVILADPEKDIDMGDGLLLDVVWPRPGWLGKKVSEKDVNNISVTVRAIAHNASILLTGDMEEKEERDILASGTDVHADILKVAHHGSKTSTSTGFLLAVHPKIAVISAGRKNTFGHPHQVILDRLRRFGIPVRVTAREGTVEIDHISP